MVEFVIFSTKWPLKPPDTQNHLKALHLATSPSLNILIPASCGDFIFVFSGSTIQKSKYILRLKELNCKYVCSLWSQYRASCIVVFKIFCPLDMKQSSSRNHVMNLWNTQADVDLMFYFKPRPMIWLQEMARIGFVRLKPNEAVVSTKNQRREVQRRN